MLSVPQVLDTLKNYGITDSEQMVRRWLREGKIKGQRSSNRKLGWQIEESDLKSFIEENSLVMQYQKEVEELKGRISQLEAENKELRSKLANVTSVSGSIKELTQDEVKIIFEEVTRGLDEQPEIIKKAYGHLMKLFKNNVTTNFYNEKYKNRNYVSPYTGKRYGSPEALIKAAIPWLINSAKTEEKRKEENEKWWLI